MDSINQDLMQTVGEAYSPYLQEGKTYHRDVVRGKYGSSQSGGIFYIEDGVKYDFTSAHMHKNKNEIVKELRKLNDSINEIKTVNLSDFYPHLPEHTRTRFTFIKDRPATMKQYGVSDLAAAIKEELDESFIGATGIGAFKKAEGIGHFTNQGGDIKIKATKTIIFEEKTFTSDSFYGLGIDLINHALDNQLKSIWFSYENDVITIQTDPAFPEHGFSAIENKAVSVNSEYAKREAAAEEAVRLRHELYTSIGTLDERPMYLNVGGFRSLNWPGHSTGTVAAKLRIINTENTTIVITDGLSDIYNDKQQDSMLTHNGIGVEFYFEFDKKVSFFSIEEHYMPALLNGVTQTALRHGNFKALMEKFGTATLEFKDSDIETWIMSGDFASNGPDTFFSNNQYSAGKPFGTLLTMGTKHVSPTFELNLEKIVLISVKPFGKEWFTKDKFLHRTEKVKTEASLELIKSFEEDGSFNTIPFSYK